MIQPRRRWILQRQRADEQRIRNAEQQRVGADGERQRQRR